MPHPATLRQTLRAATSAAHERVDARYGIFDLTDPDGYGDFLGAHSAVLPWCEALLEASGVADILPDWPERRRSAALLGDLEQVGRQPAAPAATEAPLNEAEMLGMLYVLEGSRLGGAVLARRVLGNSDPRCRAATRYLRHGQGLGLWPRFVAQFDASPVAARELATVVASALRTFELFTSNVPSATVQTNNH